METVPPTAISLLPPRRFSPLYRGDLLGRALSPGLDSAHVGGRAGPDPDKNRTGILGHYFAANGRIGFFPDEIGANRNARITGGGEYLGTERVVFYAVRECQRRFQPARPYLQSHGLCAAVSNHLCRQRARAFHPFGGFPRRDMAGKGTGANHPEVHRGRGHYRRRGRPGGEHERRRRSADGLDPGGRRGPPAGTVVPAGGRRRCDAGKSGQALPAGAAGDRYRRQRPARRQVGVDRAGGGVAAPVLDRQGS